MGERMPLSIYPSTASWLGSLSKIRMYIRGVRVPGLPAPAQCQSKPKPEQNINTYTRLRLSTSSSCRPHPLSLLKIKPGSGLHQQAYTCPLTTCRRYPLASSLKHPSNFQPRKIGITIHLHTGTHTYIHTYAYIFMDEWALESQSGVQSPCTFIFLCLSPETLFSLSLSLYRCYSCSRFSRTNTTMKKQQQQQQQSQPSPPARLLDAREAHTNARGKQANKHALLPPLACKQSSKALKWKKKSSGTGKEAAVLGSKSSPPLA